MTKVKVADKDKSKNIVSGFSKKSKAEKIAWVVENFLNNDPTAAKELTGFWHEEADLQKVLDGFSENTLSNFPMPFGVAPNFCINGKVYAVPMVIEESSVVAAASSAAKFWLSRGGFHAEVRSMTKIGQVHFLYEGNSTHLQQAFATLESELRADTQHITARMEQRGGGIQSIELLDLTHLEPNYYQLKVAFETCDSMGANFINSVLEQFGATLERFAQSHLPTEVMIIMAILSNYTPDCIVKAWVECPVEALEGACKDMDAPTFAQKFHKAIRIAEIDPYRATTHNKGIFNGVDAVVLATGNDFRAVEACGHTHAARDGQYRSLSQCSIENGVFTFSMELPLAVGTVGGLTKLHPLAKRSLEILGNPTAQELMQIIAVTGLAQNFGAIRSLVTTGIQQGHMKMHLMNILNHLGAKNGAIEATTAHFEDKAVSFNAVRVFLEEYRTTNSVLSR
ncbi:MAG: hydroxymethylglutaryl-CoA reductase, degradative [Bacteroidota bacterium]